MVTTGEGRGHVWRQTGRRISVNGKESSPVVDDDTFISSPDKLWKGEGELNSLFSLWKKDTLGQLFIIPTQEITDYHG